MHWIEWGTKNFAPLQPFWGAHHWWHSATGLLEGYLPQIGRKIEIRSLSTFRSQICDSLVLTPIAHVPSPICVVKSVFAFCMKESPTSVLRPRYTESGVSTVGRHCGWELVHCKNEEPTGNWLWYTIMTDFAWGLRYDANICHTIVVTREQTLSSFSDSAQLGRPSDVIRAKIDDAGTTHAVSSLPRNCTFVASKGSQCSQWQNRFRTKWRYSS